MSKTQPTKL